MQFVSDCFTLREQIISYFFLEVVGVAFNNVSHAVKEIEDFTKKYHG
jgi:hypothetical protein